MAPKRATRSTPSATTTTTTSVTNAQLKALIDQGVADALAACDANKSMNSDDSHNLGTSGTEGVIELTQWFERMETVFHISNCSVENQIKFATCTLLGSALTWWNSHVKTVGHDVAYAMTWTTLKKKMTDKYCPRSEIKKPKSEMWILKVKGTDVGHFKEDCLKLKNNNRDNQGGNVNASAKVYAVSRVGTNPDSNVVYDSFPSKQTTMLVLFDTGADRSFVSTAFSSQIHITSSTLDHYYDVELADRRIIGLNATIRGCTLNFLNYPFNIDLLPIKLGSLDVIIGMDWLAKYQVVIICAKKIVRIPWGNETLIFRGDC
ncbi:putative reverse transcriptase domain-containing protein [Tanacetum coccineum]